MTGGVHKIYEMRFAARVLQDERHRGRFDRDTTVPGQGMRVGITDLKIEGFSRLSESRLPDLTGASASHVS